MTKRRPKPLIRYSPDELPPRTFWRIVVGIQRAEAGSFCEQLHSLISERGGAAFYYPDLDHERTLCRYEWHYPLDGDRFGGRIGVVIDVTPADIAELEAYVTRSAIFDDMTAPVAPIPPDIVEAAQEEVRQTLEEAYGRLSPQQEQDWYTSFLVEVPYHGGFASRFQAADGALTILPTRILRDRNKRVSPFIMRTRAASREVAKARAFADIVTACALLTLANAQRFETTSANWHRNRPAPGVLPDLDSLEEDRFYPHRRRWPTLEEVAPGSHDRSEWVWSAYRRLSDTDRKVFTAALFAYYAAQTNKQDLSTASIVGLTAALSALAGRKREKCQGTLTCSYCGELNFKHDIAGEVPAIAALVVEECHIAEKDQQKELQSMLGRVYREQRSAYVHAAQLRHAEFGQGNRLPPHVPTNDAPVQDLFRYAEDLASIRKISRWTLLEWLGNRSGLPLDHELMQINRDRVTAKLLHTFTITSPCAAIFGFTSSRKGRGEEA